MKTTIKITALLFMIILINSCANYRKNRIKENTQAQLIGTWRGWYGSEPCVYSQITFNEDGTGTFTYLSETDSLTIDPPCAITWFIYVEKYDDWPNASKLKPFLSICRLEKSCAGCKTIHTDPPDTAIYMIDYINEDSTKFFLWGGGKMTTIDMFGCSGGGWFILSSKILYKQK